MFCFIFIEIILVVILGKNERAGLRLLIINIAIVKCDIATFSRKLTLNKNNKFKNETYKILSMYVVILYLKFKKFLESIFVFKRFLNNDLREPKSL